MKDVSKVLSKILLSKQPQEGEYLNEQDMLIYCSKCNTPKQQRLNGVEILGKDVVPIPCVCRKKVLDEQQQKQDELEHSRTIQRLREQGIQDKKMLAWTFANDITINNKNIEIAKRYVERFNKIKDDNLGLLLWGDVGTGKSFVAGCIANALIDLEVSVCMTNFGIVLADMMNSLIQGLCIICAVCLQVLPKKEVCRPQTPM